MTAERVAQGRWRKAFFQRRIEYWIVLVRTVETQTRECDDGRARTGMPERYGAIPIYIAIRIYATAALSSYAGAHQGRSTH